MKGLRNVLLLLAGPFVFLGCATQADVMDLQMSLEKTETQQAEIQNRLKVVESYFKERSTTVQRGQADIVIKLDQVAVDLQAAQGKLEENSHLLADFSQRMDDQAFRSKELTGRLDVLDGQIAALERTVADLEKAVQATGRGAAVPPELKSSETSESRPREAAPSDQRIVLPGRPTEKDKATGTSPSEAYGLAYNDYLKGNYDLALLGFQNFLTQFKTTSLAPNAQYWIGESFYGKKDYVKAIEAFDKVVGDYPKSDKVPGALLKAGYAWLEISDKAKAKSYLKKVVETYPLSNEGKLAKNKLAELK
ncbi:MAG TPA: tol-pal system protein YbgF [Nitrospiria bacterium]